MCLAWVNVDVRRVLDCKILRLQFFDPVVLQYAALNVGVTLFCIGRVICDGAPYFADVSPKACLENSMSDTARREIDRIMM